jgi:hypothetical protein
MRKMLSLLFSGALLATSLIAYSATSASAETTLVTCTDWAKNRTLVLKEDKEKCRPLQAAAIWRTEQSDTSINPGQMSATLRVCSSKNPLFSYKFIKSKCPKFQITTDYRRAVVKPQTPLVLNAAANGHSAAALLLATDTSTVANYAPIAYYLITNLKSNEITKVAPDVLNRLFISGLNPLTTYTFQIAAVNIDGTSPLSLITPEIRTTAVPVAAPAPAAAPALAAPAFTISSESESKPVNSAITGYTITSTGGAIASYSISPAAPAGLTFSTSTGLLSGTPTSVASATAYTITATNASGSATRIFTLTVTEIIYSVGDRGPGGGIVYYVSATPFTSAGSTCNTACKYLEVAPATWQSGGVTVETDAPRAWSSNTTTLTGQDTTTAGSESNFAGEKLNWKIGQGFYNTSVMKVAGATSTAQAAVLAYAGGGFTGQWFIPSMNELNELCKYARGQTTGVLTVACTSGGTFKSTANAGTDLGGFVENIYWSSSEGSALGARAQFFDAGGMGNIAKNNTYYVRPVRAF